MPRPEKPLALPMNALARLGAEVRHLRHGRQLTGKQLAELSGWSPSSLASLEHGRRLVGESFVRTLDEILVANGRLINLYEDVLQDGRQERTTRDARVESASIERRNIFTEGDASIYLADLTVPDGTLMQPQQEFTKSWRIRNAGTVPWRDRQLLRLGSAGGSGVVSSPVMTPIPDTDPGETVDITVECRAHIVAGTSRAYFKMSDRDRNLYFPHIYATGLALEITVV